MQVHNNASTFRLHRYIWQSYNESVFIYESLYGVIIYIRYRVVGVRQIIAVFALAVFPTCEDN